MNIFNNIEFFKSVQGILKICETVLGIICLSLIAINISDHKFILRCDLFFFTVICTYLICTVLLIVSSVMSTNTENRLRQTLFETLYHCTAFIMYFSGAVAVLSTNNSRYLISTDSFMAAGGIGVINSLLYGVSAFKSYTAYVTEG